MRNNANIVDWTDVKGVWDNPPKTDLTFVDLFCGAGGLSCGLEMAGLNGICGLDNFKEAAETYRKNFNHPLVFGDIREESVKEELYKTVEEQLNGRKLNLIVGGFPCQGFSMAGNRLVDDPRNSLYKDMVEIVNKLKPDFVVGENVRGILSMCKGQVVDKILEEYENIGYYMKVFVLNAADYGVAQTRQRVIFIGNRIGKKNLYPRQLFGPDTYKTVGETIRDLMGQPDNPEFSHVATKHNEVMKNRIMDCKEGSGLYSSYGETAKKLYWDKPSITIKENHGSVHLHPRLPRVLTVREMARLQSFPDSFKFCGPKSKQLTQVGNAVPCLLGKAVGLSVIESYNTKSLIASLVTHFGETSDEELDREWDELSYLDNIGPNVVDYIEQYRKIGLP